MAETAPVLSTAGAVPVRNVKGEISMQKVKVIRYVAGKRPAYAPDVDSSDEEEMGKHATIIRDADKVGVSDFMRKLEIGEEAEGEQQEEEETLNSEQSVQPVLVNDPRLRRLQARQIEADPAERISRHRQVVDPEVVEEGSGSEREEEGEHEEEDTEIERRRADIRRKALEKQQEEVLLVEEERSESEQSEDSEYDEYTDSEEDTAPRLKPVFVRRKDRVTLKEREKEEERKKRAEREARQLAEARIQDSKKMVADMIEKERVKIQEDDEGIQCDFRTDDENDEEEYEAWKVRELKRIKRDREERETLLREKDEIERIHNMTEEERLKEFAANPKVVVNRTEQSKYRFLQKYYHKGAFFMDKQEDVYTRDVAMPTLEDRFNKELLPQAMQVKNFGRAGRTKYTHLANEDTTKDLERDHPWIIPTQQNQNFFSHAGGARPVFEKPTGRKRKAT